MPEAGGTVVPLGVFDLAVAALLVISAGVVSLALRLRLERKLALASVRTVVQLLLIGHVLRAVFRIHSPWLLLAVLLAMTIAASRAAVARPSRGFPGASWRAFATLVCCGFLTTFAVTSVVIGVEPWWEPRYVIPLLGMVLGNGLTGISLCLDQLLRTLSERKAEVEMELAHGATRWEAARGPIREAVRSGMVPILNSMMVVGIVALPGMMTGQILAGSDPLTAVKYQVVVMFMIAGATAFGCMVMALLVHRRLFNDRHQLLAGDIRVREG